MEAGDNSGLKEIYQEKIDELTKENDEFRDKVD